MKISQDTRDDLIVAGKAFLYTALSGLSGLFVYFLCYVVTA
jgi:hypothetical protein